MSRLLVFSMTPFTPPRRDILRTLSLGVAGGLLGGLARAADPIGKAKSVILIFNDGAPSHIDLWDPKPEAPAEVRGDFLPIRTNVDGIPDFGTAAPDGEAHGRIALVRSVHHEHQGHNSGMYGATVVGRPYRVDSTLINPSRTDFPCFGTLMDGSRNATATADRCRPTSSPRGRHCDSRAYVTPGQFGGCLGAQYDPFVLNTDRMPPITGRRASRSTARSERPGSANGSGC